MGNARKLMKYRILFVILDCQIFKPCSRRAFFRAYKRLAHLYEQSPGIDRNNHIQLISIQAIPNEENYVGRKSNDISAA